MHCNYDRLKHIMRKIHLEKRKRVLHLSLVLTVKHDCGKLQDFRVEKGITGNHNAEIE